MNFLTENLSGASYIIIRYIMFKKKELDIYRFENAAAAGDFAARKCSELGNRGDFAIFG